MKVLITDVENIFDRPVQPIRKTAIFTLSDPLVCCVPGTARILKGALSLEIISLQFVLRTTPVELRRTDARTPAPQTPLVGAGGALCTQGANARPSSPF